MRQGLTGTLDGLADHLAKAEGHMNAMNLVSKWAGWGPQMQSVLRIVAAFMFILPGTMKLFAFPAGMPPAGGTAPLMSQIWIGGILEVVGGALLLLGLFTRPVAFLLAGEMAVAYFQFHAPKGFWPIAERRRRRRALLLRLALLLGRGRGTVEPGCPEGKVMKVPSWGRRQDHRPRRSRRTRHGDTRWCGPRDGSDMKGRDQDPRSIDAIFDQVKDVDAEVAFAGNARFVPLARLSDDDIAYSLKSKLLGQVELIRQALQHVREGGSVTVTSGVLAQRPMPGGAAISKINVGLEGFVAARPRRLRRGVRVNAVSPPWVSETLVALKMDPSLGLPAATVARAYVVAVTGRGNGETLDPAASA